MNLKVKRFIGLVLPLTALSAFGQQPGTPPQQANPTPGCSVTPAQLETNRKAALAFYDPSADKLTVIDPSYKQHNPQFVKRAQDNHQTDYEVARAAFGGGAGRGGPPGGGRGAGNGPQPPPGNQAEVVTADCDIVTIVHKQYRPDPTPGSEGRFFEAFTFDTFRVRDGKLVEHWDNAVINPPPPVVVPAGNVDGGNLVRVVASLDKTSMFYSSVLGLSVTTESRSGYPWDTKPWKAPKNIATVAIPGAKWAINLIEQSSGKAQLPTYRVQDPGAVTLILFVRDLDAVVAKAKQFGSRVVTTGGGIINVGRGNYPIRAEVVQDPDGGFVELLQGGAAQMVGAGPNDSILRANLRFTVENTEQSQKLYRDAFGLEFRGGPNNDPTVAAMLGVDGGKITLTNTQLPDSMMTLEFLEVEGLDRKPVRAGIQEAGAAYLYLGTRSFDSLMGKVQSAGAGKVVAPAATGTKRATIADANNVNVVLSDDGAALRP